MRKKKFAGIISFAIIFAMVLTSFLSTGVVAFGTNTNAKYSKDGAKVSREYRQGEAIVLLKSSVAKDISKKSLAETNKAIDFTGDIKIVKKFDFGTYSKKNKDATANSSKKTTTVNLEIVKVASEKKTTKEIISELSKDKRVKAVIPNYKVEVKGLTNDPYSSEQWGLENIQIDSMWNNNTTGGEKVVAVIDTGVDYTNEDLKDNMWRNTSSKLMGKYGYDFVNEDNDPIDDNGHGSHCAGIIGATGNNNKGISGVNQKIKIMALKFLDYNGTGDLEDAISSYEYISKAQDLGVNVVAINNSWGSSFSAKEEDDEDWDDEDWDEEIDEATIFGELMDATGDKGAISVWAAGNESNDLDESEKTAMASSSEYGISVAALNKENKLASFSNSGSKSVDIAAPGTDILSTVSYDCFNPSIYSEEKINNICGTFEGYEDDINTEDIKIVKDSKSKAEMEISKSSVSFKGNSSLKLSIKGAENGEIVAFGVPYNTKDAENPYLSMMVATEGKYGETIMLPPLMCVLDLKNMPNFDTLKDQVGNSFNVLFMENLIPIYEESDNWSHLSFKGSETGKNEERYIVYAFRYEGGGDYAAYIDDFGITKNGVDPSEFGKYDYLSGTSMATPFVTGSIALAREWITDMEDDKTNKGDMALASKTVILDNARSVEDLKTKVADGKTLNMNIISNAPVIKRVSMDSKKKIVIEGKGFTSETKVLVDGKEIDKISVSNNKIVIAGSDYANKQVTIEVKNTIGLSKKTQIIKYNKKSYTKIADGVPNVEIIDDIPKMFTNGSDIFIGDTMGKRLNISKYNKKTGKFRMAATVGGLFKVPGVKAPEIIGNPVICDNAVYCLVREYETGSAEGIIGTETKIVAVDLSKKRGQSITLPKEYNKITESAIGTYNGDIYVAGGYDLEKEKSSTLVYRYTPATKKWSKTKSLPFGKCGGTMAQSGNSLVYAFGADETGNMPKTVVFNGTSWKTSSKNLEGGKYSEKNISGEIYKMYEGRVNVVSGGVVLTGAQLDGYGDTVKYNVAKDSYTAERYQFINNKNKDSFDSVTVGEYIYGIGITPKDWGIYRGKLTNGCVQAIGKFKNGTVENANTNFLPGTKITLKAKPNKGCYLKSFVVNGKKVKGNVKAIRTTKNIKVSATFGKYVSKITLNKKAITLAAGKTYRLKAKVSPTSATNKSIKWTSSNTKYATVSSNGTVKVKASGKGKTVKITATAKDGSRKKAVCTVKIK